MAQPSRTIVFALGVLLLFLLINFNPNLGVAYALIFILTIVLILLDPKITIDLDLSKSNLLQDLITGIAGYAAFIGVAFVAVSLIQTGAQLLGLESVIGLMAELQPVFANNKFLSAITFGLLVPIIENMFFFGVGIEFLSDKLNIPITVTNISSYALYAIVAFMFMVFHFTAKGVPTSPGQLINDPALLVTFIFGLVSCVVVAVSKESKGRNDLRPSIFMHQIANMAAVLRKLAII